MAVILQPPCASQEAIGVHRVTGQADYAGVRPCCCSDVEQDVSSDCDIRRLFVAKGVSTVEQVPITWRTHDERPICTKLLQTRTGLVRNKIPFADKGLRSSRSRPNHTHLGHKIWGSQAYDLGFCKPKQWTGATDTKRRVIRFTWQH